MQFSQLNQTTKTVKQTKNYICVYSCCCLLLICNISTVLPQKMHSMLTFGQMEKSCLVPCVRDMTMGFVLANKYCYHHTVPCVAVVADHLRKCWLRAEGALWENSLSLRRVGQEVLATYAVSSMQYLIKHMHRHEIQLICRYVLISVACEQLRMRAHVFLFFFCFDYLVYTCLRMYHR